MKKIHCILISALLCLLSLGCGKEKSLVYYDIRTESAPFFEVYASLIGTGSFFRCLGTQFLQEEPVQLWILFDDDSSKVELYKYRMDGSRELLMGGLPEEIFSASNPLGYIDVSGSLYLFYNTDKSANITIKYDSSGTQDYRHEEESSLYVSDICQIPDGRIFINYSIGEEPYALGELDPATGSISRVSSFRYDYTMWMGTGSGGLLCMGMDGIFEIEPENGSKENIWPFTGTTFEENALGQVLDFMVTEEGEVRLLCQKHVGSPVMYETLQKVEVEEKRKPVVMRGLEFSGDDGAWLKQMVYRFNEGNDAYFVTLEECGSDADWDDYARQTSIEVGAGKGPDIFYGDVLGEYAYNIARKGGFVDLDPYLEKAGSPL